MLCPCCIHMYIVLVILYYTLYNITSTWRYLTECLYLMFGHDHGSLSYIRSRLINGVQDNISTRAQTKMADLSWLYTFFAYCFGMIYMQTTWFMTLFSCISATLRSKEKSCSMCYTLNTVIEVSFYPKNIIVIYAISHLWHIVNLTVIYSI